MKLKTFTFAIPSDLRQRVSDFHDSKRLEWPGISISKIVCYLIDAGLKSVGF